MGRPLTFEEAAKRLKQRVPHIKLERFTGTNSECDIYCSKHRTHDTYVSFTMVKGCRECGRDKWRVANPATTHKSYVALVKAGAGKRIRVVGEYVNANVKIEHHCNDCNTSLMVSPKSMLAHFGCRNCGYAKGAATGSKYREVKLGRRTVKVQGGESEALHFLVKTLNVDPKSVIVGSDGKIPGIHYTLDGVKRLYRPDFMLPKFNRLVEVKSTWYFGLTNKDFYTKLVAKAKACVAQGYGFRVIICNLVNSAPLLLPKNWYEMTHKQFQKFWISTYGLTLNGCVCRS